MPDCTVVGAGIAGAACANSLARRGWNVTVLEAAAETGGAPVLPVGLFAPHVSADDAIFSQVTRRGIALTIASARSLLREGEDWALTGIAERLEDGGWRVQEQAGWIKPACWIAALLRHPRIAVRYGERANAAGGRGLTVIAAGWRSIALAGGGIALQPIRGQLSWGRRAAGDDDVFPAQPRNGHGSFAPAIPHEGGAAWYCGSSFLRDETADDLRAADHAANLARLQVLAPEAAARLRPRFEAGEVQGWAGVRCASRDRLPAVGPLPGEENDGVWLCTAMGSRGLTFAVLCAELLAARLHGEPLPLEPRLARALDVNRRSLRGESAAAARQS